MTKLRADRLNRLSKINSAENYLEIGVNKGVTLRRVDVQRKVGVDPSFNFNTEEVDHKAELHEVTSDKYFETCGTSKKFDLIYLDGLHEYNQTLRDFFNTLSYSHENTIWLFDDTNPDSYEASLYPQRITKEVRVRTGNRDNSWMGDVYKCVFFLNKFLRDFEYATFLEHGQTVVWRKKISSEVEFCIPDDMDITNMSYADFVSYRDSVLNFKTDEEIFSRVQKSLGIKDQSELLADVSDS